MDFVNETIAQLRELFASMTPGARVTAGLLLVTVVVSLGFLVKQGTSGPDEYLFGGEPIARSQIARMEAAMSTAGLGNFTVVGNHIRIPRGQKAAYIAAIADAGELPPDVHKMMDEALSKGSIFDSSEVKRQRIKAAREQQLSLIVSQMQWVERAMVIFDEREERGLRSAREASASVSVMPAVGQTITSQRARNLKDLVASANNMPTDQVTITNLGNDSVASSDALDPEDFTQPYYATKARIEQSLRGDLMAQLSYIPGVRVQVKADLDDTVEKRTVRVNPGTQPALMRKQESLETKDQVSGGGAGGRPGLEAQGPGRNGADSAVASQDQTKTSLEQTTLDNVVGSDSEETVTAGFALKRADASIAVPKSYVLSVYYEQVKEKTGAEPDEIDQDRVDALQAQIKAQVEALVKPLLPNLAIGENEYGQANVQFFHDLPGEEIPLPSLTSNALVYAERHWNTLAMVGVALVSLVMLRSLANSTGGEGPLPSVASLQLDTGSDGSDEEESEPNRQKLRLRKADTLKDDLTEMVSSDPDAAAEILKSWISNAG